MAELYTVVVPENVKPGDTFQTVAGSDIITVTCPASARPGSELTLKLQKRQDEVLNGLNEPNQSDYATVWLCLDSLLFLLFILAFSLPAFAVQHISKSCLVVNPVTNTPVTKLYYSLYHGVGTIADCFTNSGNVCLKWSENSIWDTFDQLTVDDNEEMMMSSNSSWSVAEVLIPIAAFCCLLAAFFHTYSQWRYNFEQIFFIFIGGGLVFISWIFGLVAINCIVYSDVTSSSAWDRFYSGGNNLINLIEGTNTVGPIPTDCTVTVFYVDAGILLMIATPIAFFTSIAMVISGCCVACYRTDPFYYTSNTSSKFYPQPLVVYIDQNPHGSKQDEEKTPPSLPIVSVAAESEVFKSDDIIRMSESSTVRIVASSNF